MPTDRRRAFYIWQLMPGGKTFVELGRVLGITSSGVSRMLNGERMPVAHHEKLVQAGVPASLLPRPENVRRGPKRKAERQ